MENKAITLEERYQAASRWYNLKPNTMASSQGSILGNLIPLFPCHACNMSKILFIVLLGTA